MTAGRVPGASSSNLDATGFVIVRRGRTVRCGSAFGLVQRVRCGSAVVAITGAGRAYPFRCSELTVVALPGR